MARKQRSKILSKNGNLRPFSILTFTMCIAYARKYHNMHFPIPLQYGKKLRICILQNFTLHCGQNLAEERRGRVQNLCRYCSFLSLSQILGLEACHLSLTLGFPKDKSGEKCTPKSVTVTSLTLLADVSGDRDAQTPPLVLEELDAVFLLLR